MAAPIIIRAELADSDIRRAAQETERVFKSAIDNINRSIKGLGDTLAGVGRNLPSGLGGGRGGGGGSFRNPADEAVKLAQAQARLQQVSGSTTQAIRTLQSALDNSTASTMRQVTAQTQLQRLLNQQNFTRFASTIREAGESIQQAGYALTGFSVGILNLGRGAVQSAISIDKQVNSLRALTGSAAAAEARFKQLFETAQRSPGLTTNLALTLDTQLRAAKVSQTAIDKVLPAVGKLNAVSPLGDPQRFVQNLVQLVTQNFEKIDLKELVGQSPIAGQLVAQIFNVDNPINAEAIRASAEKLGIRTTEQFFSAFAKAAATNPGLANVQESIASQLEKLQDRITVALRPLGLAILRSITPAVEAVVPLVERVLGVFNGLPRALQTAVVAFGALGAAIGPAVIGIGSFIQTAGAIGNMIAVFKGVEAAGLTASAGVVTLTTSLRAAASASLAFLATPLGLTLTAVAAAVTIGVVAWANYKSATDLAIESSGKLNATVGNLSALDANIKALKDRTLTADQLNRAISQLDPAEQLYVKTLKTQEEQIRRTTAELERKRQIELNVAEIQRKDVIAGIVESFQAYQQQSARLSELSKTYESAKLSVEKYGQSTEVTTTNGRTFVTVGEQVQSQLKTIESAYLGADRQANQYRTASDNLAKSFIESSGGADKARAEIDRLAATKQISAQSANAARSAIDAFTATLNKDADAAANTTRELYNVRDALAALSRQGAQSVIRDTLTQVAKESKGDLAKARKRAQELLRLNDDFYQAVQFEKKIGPVEEQLLKDFDPTPGRRGGGSGATKERAIAKSSLDGRLSDLQNFAREANTVEDRLLAELQARFEDGKVATGDYYRERLNIQQYALDAEIAALKAQQAEVQKAITTAKDQERIRLSEKFRDLQTEINNKIREQGELSIRNLREFKKAVGALPGVDITKQEEVLIPQDRPKIIQDALEKTNRLREEGLRYNQLDSELSIKEIQIQNAVNAGILTEVEGRKATLAIQREYRDALIASLESEQQLQDRLGNTDQVRQLSERIERLKGLGVELDNTQRFLRGVGSGIEDVGDAFERFGQNVSNSFRDVRNLFDGLKNAVKSFFADLLGNSLQKLVKGTLGALFGQQGQQAGGNQNPFASILGGVFGGGGQQGAGSFGGLFGGGGGGFLTPGFNPNAGGGGLGSLLGGGAFGGLFGGAATPASVSLGGLPAGRSFPVGLSTQPGGVATGSGGVFGKLLGGLGLGGLFNGIGFGKAAGSGGALASALPFLGVNLGVGLGGSSGLGKILGGVGGGLLGVGLSAAPAIFGAGGALASPTIAALFSNPFTAIAGAGLLVGAFFLGRAKQRRKDEQTSGDYLQEAIDSIRDLRSGIARDEIDGKDARSIFNKQILETFKQQISTLKTKSVRESRLTNQVNDLKKLYADEVVPEVEKQRTRKKIFGKLTPEFATGGIMQRDGFAYLHKDEIIVNRSQQSPQLLRAAAASGVPGVNTTVATAGSGGPIVVNLAVEVGMSKSGAEEIVIAGMESDAGQNIVVNLVHAGQKARELRR